MQTTLSHLRLHTTYWQTPAGRATLAWEQTVLEAFAERVFGFYAVSFDLPQLNPLRQSTIHHRIHVLSGGAGTTASTANTASTENTASSANTANSKDATNAAHTLNAAMQGLAGGQVAQFDLNDWPIQDDSLDYIVLPHVLEFALDPHAVLREAARCLRPGGSMALTAFNPHSLLGWQAGRCELGKRDAWVSRRRLIDWMALLNLHTDRGAFGQWRPIHMQAQGFARLGWMDNAGERWWPHLANVYALRVVKRLSPDLRQLSPKKGSLFAVPQRSGAVTTAQGAAQP